MRFLSFCFSLLPIKLKLMWMGLLVVLQELLVLDGSFRLVGSLLEKLLLCLCNLFKVLRRKFLLLLSYLGILFKLEIDSIFVVKLFQNCYINDPLGFWARWYNCLLMLEAVEFLVSHIFCDDNKVANELPKYVV